MGTVFYVARISSRKIEGISENLEGTSSNVTGSLENLNAMGGELAESSTQAAASIEETAASLEELTSMVTFNTQNAKEAAKVSSDSSRLALEGEQKLSSLIASMNQIESSSQKIKEIITIIDDIAFQTNLLALNASVEAARAGEHGKGFAVVADAVRSLAQRSAIAAKDISSLILSSVEQIQESTQQTQDSGKVLNHISTSVQKVSQLNQEIATASEEQASGINQISTAITALDQMIQKNAAQAEQIVSTAIEIKDQSQVLNSTVTMLKGNTLQKAA